MSTPDVRQRKNVTVTKTTTVTATPADKIKNEDKSSIWMDVARTITFLVLVSSAASYLVTRDSFAWGLKRPDWTRPEVIQTWLSGPKQYTDADLLEFDGSAPEKPILLAINGSIYDVSAGRRHYGPGGSYNFFAGRDASRAFVTNCFKEDGNPDMRGVENIYIPRDDPEIDSLYTKPQLKILKENERRNAKKEVDKALRHWVDFFAGSGKYPKIGEVKREKGWETKGPAPTLCASAEERRPVRATPEQFKAAAAAAAGAGKAV